MSDVSKARALPGVPFEAKAKRKKRKDIDAAASTLTPEFEEIRQLLSGQPLRGLDPTMRGPTGHGWPK